MTDEPDLPDEWTTAELLRRVDRGWQWLSERVAAYPEERLDEPVGGGGWTRRQMLHHLAVWHGLTTRRLREYNSSGLRPAGLDSDAVNAESMTTGAGMSRAALVAELERSFVELRREVAKLRDDQLPEHDYWPGGVVVGNTFGHYEEHRADLEDAPAAA